MGHRGNLYGLLTPSLTSNIAFHNSEVKWMEIQILKARVKNLLSTFQLKPLFTVHVKLIIKYPPVFRI